MTRRLWKIGWLCLLLASGALTTTAQPAGPVVRRFHHTAWNSEDGLGAVFDIQQSSDGYLWLTTSTGDFRFDGVRFQSVAEATHGVVQDREIHSVFASVHGGVWFKTRGAGLLLWKDDRLTTFPDRRCTPTRREGIAEGSDGSLWLQGSSGLFRLKSMTCQPIGPEQGYPGGSPAAVLGDRSGTVWVLSSTGALLFLPAGQSRFRVFPYTAGATTESVAAGSTHSSFLHQAPDGTLWLSDDLGLRRITNRDGSPANSKAHFESRKSEIHFGDFTFASDGSIWAATDRGARLFEHVDLWKTVWADADSQGESFSSSQGLSSNIAWKVFVDRERTVWVGTNSGLDRLRRTPLSTVSFAETQEHDFAVLPDAKGSVVTGNETLPPVRLGKDGTILRYPGIGGTICLRRDRHGVIWAAGPGPGPTPRPALWRILGLRPLSLPYPQQALGAILSFTFDRNNDLWVSTASGGAYHFVQGRWQNQNAALGKKPGVLGAMASDDTGNVWFGFSNKLVRWNGSSYQSFSFPGGTHGVSESTISVRGDHVWLAGSGGVQLFSGDRFRIMRWQDPNLPDRISGIVETSDGDLWMNGFSGITHVSAGEVSHWLKDSDYAVAAERFNALDGLSGFSAERVPEPSVVEAPDGVLWFATTKGIASLDPKSLGFDRNLLAPPVEISSIVANGTSYVANSRITLPKRTNSLQINYTALSLAIPERVRFRYRLDGVDTEWQEAGSRREAFYNSLSPGQYRFHVIACNNDGVWNTVGDSVAFSIPPLFYQTGGFKFISLVCAAGFIWLMVRRHIRNIARQLQNALGERLAERERIARELHDTLLQSLFALTLHFQNAADQLPQDDPARRALNEALTQSDTVMREGRQRIRNLRSSRTDATALVDALAEYGHQVQVLRHAHFQVFAEGMQRPLNPVFQEEILLIGREAITNAFKHADAMSVVVIVEYLPGAIHLCVRDDGHGIEDAVLEAGSRRDHWGLPGMRERARRIHGKLQIARRKDGGTQVDLHLSTGNLYQGEDPGPAGRWSWLRWLRREDMPSSLDKPSGS